MTNASARPGHAARQPAPPGATLVTRLLRHHFDVEGDGYCVADHLVAAGEGVGHVDHAEILAIDFGGGGGAAAGAHHLDDLVGPVTSKVTSLVTPWMVRLPVILEVSSPVADDFCGLKSDGRDIWLTSKK